MEQANGTPATNSSIPQGRRSPSPRRRLSVVIPAKNEARNIGWVISRLPAIVDEVVLVDGHSTDGTIEVARALRPDVVVVQDDAPGKGAALRAGFAAATGDHIVMMDADGSMDPVEIPVLLAKLAEGNDLVKGSRFLGGGGSEDFSLLRKLGNRGLLLVANVLFGSSSSELCYGYAAFSRAAVLGLELTAVGFEVETQLFLRATRSGLRVAEVPSFEAARRSGVSNLHTFRDGWRVLVTIFAERVRRSQSQPVTVGRLEGIFPNAPMPVAVPIHAGYRAISSSGETQTS
jgi:glycosyltransferase involved in cell wall biosynthesis